MKKEFQYTSQRGHAMAATLYGSDLPADSPCIVYIHGFKGFKDWGFAPPTGEFFAEKGFRVLAFNFSHNGIGEDLLNFTELDKFRENTFSLELEEAQEMIRLLAGGEYFGNAAGIPIGLIGHSRGGGAAILSGAHMPEVSAICTWASVANYARYPQELIKMWKEQGYWDIPNSRTGQIMQIGYGLHEDLLKHQDHKLNIRKAVETTKKPLCFIHGEADTAVPAKDARALFEWAEWTPAELHMISEGGHTFGAKHPWQGSTPELDQVWSISLDFFTKHLKA